MADDHDFIPNRFTTFLRHVETHGFNHKACWEWTGASKGNGYGNVRQGKANRTAHAVSYELFVGSIPDGKEVCHTCDTRCCVNPDHLFVGTRRENMADMSEKGRGAGPHRRRLREGRVQEIRQRLAAGHSPRKISIQMDVHYGTVVNIAEGKSYGGIGQ